MPTQGGPSWYVVVNDGTVEDDRYHYQIALINFLNGYQVMMSRKGQGQISNQSKLEGPDFQSKQLSRKGGFPPKKKKMSI